MTIGHASYSNKGSRKKNEDSLYAGGSRDGYLFIVADGLGGLRGSEMASAAAVKIISEMFGTDAANFSVDKAIERANLEISDMNDDSVVPMTTVAIAFVGEKETTLATVGDTRIYAFCNDKLVYQSIDHSISQMAVLVGEITDSDIRTHEDRNKLTQALGMKDRLHPEIKTISNDSYNALLLCSDGFWEYVYEDEMAEMLAESKDQQEWLDKMRRIMLDRVSCNYDNNTAITVVKKVGR